MSLENHEESLFENRSSPEYRFTFNDDIEFKLNWDNTILRLFREGDGLYNHVMHRTEDGSVYRFFAETAICNLLKAEDYPYQFSPTVDEDTKEWAIKGYLTIDDSELQGLLDQ